jgi:hypothetical protein
VRKAEWQVHYSCTDISNITNRWYSSARKAGAHNRRMACNLIVIARLHPQRHRHFFMTTFRASPTKLTAFQRQSHECSCYVTRRILAPPPLW